MAYEFLPTNFKDDIINAEINERRKYRMIQNDDGTVSFEDVTDYLQKGDLFGSGNVNDINRKINGINGTTTVSYIISRRMEKCKLVRYAVSEIEYNEKTGQAQSVNSSNIDVANPSATWEIDLEPKKLYNFTLDCREFIANIQESYEGSRISMIGMEYQLTAVSPCFYQLFCYGNGTGMNSVYFYPIVYNFSDKIYKRFTTNGLFELKIAIYSKMGDL